VLPVFVTKASSAALIWTLSPSTVHKDQTENALKCKQYLNYYTYYFLLVAKRKRSKEQFNLCRAAKAQIIIKCENYKTAYDINLILIKSRFRHCIYDGKYGTLCFHPIFISKKHFGLGNKVVIKKLQSLNIGLPLVPCHPLLYVLVKYSTSCCFISLFVARAKSYCPAAQHK
jgi:hypothetical protein